MKVKIVKSTMADLKRVEVGEVVDLSDRSADLLLRMGKAVEYVEVKPKVKRKSSSV